MICRKAKRASSDCVDVDQRKPIPLLRSRVAVPLNSSLKVTARLYDDSLSGKDEIAVGTVEFPAEITHKTSINSIPGEDGKRVNVTVYWTFDF